MIIAMFDLVLHKSKVKLCKVFPIDDHQELNFEASFSLFCKYQQAVHRDPIEKLSVKRVSIWSVVLSYCMLHLLIFVNRLKQCSHTQDPVNSLTLLHLSTNYI